MTVHEDGHPTGAAVSIKLTDIANHSAARRHGSANTTCPVPEPFTQSPSQVHLRRATFDQQSPPTAQTRDLSTSVQTTAPPPPTGLLHIVRAWWSNNITLSLDHLPQAPTTNSDPRDYLALERTHLAYVRTAVSLVSFGVVLVQLFILKGVNRITGVCLGAICCGAGFLVVLMGCIRYFVQQKALERGKATAGGWDTLAVGTLVFAIVAAILVIVVVED